MVGLPKSIIKRYGISKAAWAAYRKAKPKAKPKVEKMAKKTKRRRATKKSTRRGGSKGIIGGMSLKGLLFGTGLLFASKYAVNMIAPNIPFKKPVSALGAGAVASVAGLPGKALISYGIMDAGSDLVANFLGGGLGVAKSSGGYDL